MSPQVIGVLLFLAIFGLLLSALYFVVEVPAARRRRLARVSSVQRTFQPDASEGTAERPRWAARREPPGRLAAMAPGRDWLERRLQQAGMEVTVEVVQVACVSGAALGLLAAIVLGQPWLASLLLALAGGAAPLAVVERKRSQRIARFEEQFPDAIDLLARAVRAGHAFTTGFELIARELSEPVASEFRIAWEQQNLGLPLRDALGNLAQRMPTPDVKVFVSALQIQRETGGNLAEILDKLSIVIRERFKLYRQVKVFTAEGRISMWVLTALPPITAVLLWVVNREYIVELVRDPTGIKMTWTGVALLVAGFFVIQRLVNVKV